MDTIKTYVASLAGTTRNYVDAEGCHCSRSDKELEGLAWIPSNGLMEGYHVRWNPHVENPLSAAARALDAHVWDDFLKRAALARKILAYGRENEGEFPPPSWDGSPDVVRRNTKEQFRVLAALRADRTSVSNFFNNTPAPARTFCSFIAYMKLDRDDIAHRRAVRQWAAHWVEAEVTRLLVYVEYAGEFSRTVHCACGEQHALDESDTTWCHYSHSQWDSVKYAMLLETDFARVFNPALLRSDARIDIWISYNVAGLVPDEYTIRDYPEWDLKEHYWPGWYRFCSDMIGA